MSFTMDISRVTGSLRSFQAQMKGEIAKKAIREGVEMMGLIANTVGDQKTPHLTGALRGEAGANTVAIEVQGDNGSEITGTISYNMPYAARWHFLPPDVPVNWSDKTGVDRNWVGRIAESEQLSGMVIKVVSESYRQNTERRKFQ